MNYVLVCDDEEGIVASYRQYLEPATGGSAIDRLRKLKGTSAAAARGVLPEHWSVLTAASGEEALKLAARVKDEGAEICVGFFDVKMPGIDGIETMLRLLEIFPRMRCAVVSAYNDRPVDHINALLSPAHQDSWDYLAKPFTDQEIRQKTRMLVSTWLHAQAEEKARAELAALNASLEEVVIARTQELARTQSQLALSERLVAMGTLAAGIGHEINNPLAYLTVNLEFVTDELEDGTVTGPDAAMIELRTALFECRQGADRIRSVMGGLKALSRQRDEERRVFEIGSVLEPAIAMTHNEIRHRAKLVKRYGPTPPVDGDDTRLTQVFINLLMNAAQSIPDGRIREHEIVVTTTTDEQGRAVIEVEDSGCGIAPEHLRSIFDPFFTLKPVGVGTGLGLSISHGIVAQLGGSIEVESTLGKGSTFRVLLPPAKRQAVSPLQDEGALEGARRGRVLAIDDEPAIGSVIKRILSHEHDVVVARSGRDGIALVTSGLRFDAILCDLMMPDVTGMDVHSALSSVAPDQAARMVFVTGGAFTPAAREFLERVPNARFDKPFGRKALQEMVTSLIKHSPPVGEIRLEGLRT